MCPNCDKKFSFKKASAFLAIVGVIIFGLEVKASGTKGHMNHGEKVSSSSSKKIKVNEKEKKVILSALAAYDQLHASYFEYNEENIIVRAKNLSDKIKLINEKMIVEEIKKDNVQKLIGAIKSKNSRSINNSLMDNISKRLNDIIVSKIDLGGQYGLFYCPMVEKYWLQNIKNMSQVHNPYAPEMPDCGSQKS
jgi:CHAT domain-containing protein